jgi:Fe-Mn family superoxide dismutase
MTYELPKLDYEYGALAPVLSADLLELHHSKHHAAYVTGANGNVEALNEARKNGDYGKINQLEKDLAFHMSGHVFHSIFWKNLSPNGGGEPGGALKSQIDKDFGSADTLRQQMTSAATGIQGSGWAALAWEPVGGRLVVEQVFDHQTNVAQGAVPLLVLDMWEHAFYLDYQNRKAEWVKGYWDIVNWSDVESRLGRAQKLELI